MMVDLNGYKVGIRQIRQYATEHNISDVQATKLFQRCFHQIETDYSRKSNKLLRLSVLFAFIFIISLAFYERDWLNNALTRIFQNSIYPGLYVLRHVAVPFLTLYPSLSGLYIVVIY